MTNTNTMSRRSILSRAAAGTAMAALPTAAIVSKDALAGSDPIYAAIAEHRAARATAGPIPSADQSYNEMPAELRRFGPSITIGNKTTGVKEHIEVLFGILAFTRNLQDAGRDSDAYRSWRSEFDKAHADWDAEVARCERRDAWEQEHHVIDDAREEAWKMIDEADGRLFDIVPTTLRGVAALVEYLAEIVTNAEVDAECPMCGGCEAKALANLGEALRSMPATA
jgi:hypothetical protein